MGQRGSQPEARVLLLGLDNSGKSTLLYQLKRNVCVGTVPTIGFNVEMLDARKNGKNVALTMWDVGGQRAMRRHWKSFHQDARAVVFVLDSSDLPRLEEARRELENTLRSEQLRGLPLVLLANKQDVGDAVTVTEIKDRFDLIRTCSDRAWFIQPCSAKTGVGVEDAFRRVVQMVKLPSESGAMTHSIKERVHTIKASHRH